MFTMRPLLRKASQARIIKYLTTVTSNIKYNYGDNLDITIPPVESIVNFSISSVWEENCTLTVPENLKSSFVSSYELERHLTSIVFDQEVLNSLCPRGSFNVTATVPEHCNIRIKGSHVNLRLKGKIQGDVHVELDSGAIDIDKLRGNINITNWNGEITVRKALEGNITVKSKKLVAKMINGEKIQLVALEHEIEALYTSGRMSADVSSYGDTVIEILQGFSNVTSDSGNISVSGIDGGINAHSLRGDVSLQINQLSSPAIEHDKDITVFCSSAKADEGNVLVKIDPKVVATLLCESKPQLSSQNVDPNLIFVDSDVFVRDEITLGVNEEVRKQNKGTATIVSGRLTGRSQLIIPSRSTNSGKINILEHERLQDIVNESNKSSLHLKSAGLIRVDSLSWAEIIRRKHFGGTDNR